MRKVIAILMVLWITGVIVFVVISYERRASSQAAQWPTVQGNITSTQTMSRPTPLGDTSYRLNAQFEYEVEGKLYHSAQVWHVGGLKEEQEYPLGTSVTVYYDPAKPNKSVIEPGKLFDFGEWLLEILSGIYGGTLYFIVVSVLIWLSCSVPTNKLEESNEVVPGLR